MPEAGAMLSGPQKRSCGSLIPLRDVPAIPNLKTDPVHPTAMAIEDAGQTPSEALPGSLLDNPIWSALTTDHAHLALGGSQARRYPEEIGPLSGMSVQSAEGYDALRLLAGPGGVVGLFFREPLRLPRGWTVLRGGTILQMIACRPSILRASSATDTQLRPLTAADAPAMVELAELTEPGPFRLRTIELGNFFGIFRSGRLVAMAGKRMHLPGCVEVSAVCTHPEARGRGYARALMSLVMDEIVQSGRTPFLHTLAGNDTAIRLYESLGFSARQRFEYAAIQWEH
jgi:ribosomal protein S18 acetylase RimI-like enzyme